MWKAAPVKLEVETMKSEEPLRGLHGERPTGDVKPPRPSPRASLRPSPRASPVPAPRKSKLKASKL